MKLVMNNDVKSVIMRYRGWEQRLHSTGQQAIDGGFSHFIPTPANTEVTKASLPM